MFRPIEDDAEKKSQRSSENQIFVSRNISTAIFSNQQNPLGEKDRLFKSSSTYLQKTWPLQSKHLSIMRNPSILNLNQGAEGNQTSRWMKTLNLSSPSLQPITRSEVSPKSNHSKASDIYDSNKNQLPKVEVARDSKKYRDRFVPVISNSAAVSTMKGVKPGRNDWINQDSSFFLQTGRYMGEVYCILDGHGEDGHLVAQLCKSALPQLIMTFPEDLRKAFSQMQGKLLSSREVKTSFPPFFILCNFHNLNILQINVDCSGATCVIVVVRNQEITVAHCGDSRCILGRRSTIVNGGNYHAIPLTTDHKPDLPEELRRITCCGGQVGSRQFVSQGGDRHSPGRVTFGPCRVWYRHGTEKLGLAMSRSLGDAVAHTVGVSSEPELLHQPLDARDEFLILATDGLWDVVDSSQAIRFVGNLIVRAGIEGIDWSPHEASLQLAQLARRRWETVSSMIDDITVLVVKLVNTH